MLRPTTAAFSIFGGGLLMLRPTTAAALSSVATLAATIGAALVALAPPPLVAARLTASQPALFVEVRRAQDPPKLLRCPAHARRHAAVKGEQEHAGRRERHVRQRMRRRVGHVRQRRRGRRRGGERALGGKTAVARGGVGRGCRPRRRLIELGHGGRCPSRRLSLSRQRRPERPSQPARLRLRRQSQRRVRRARHGACEGVAGLG